jgi:glucose-1-phosphatase
MIKIILFDIGGVYSEGTFDGFTKKACKVLKLNCDELSYHKPLFDEELCRGKITVEECFRRYFNVPISEEQMKTLIDMWLETWQPSEEMAILVNKLKVNYKLGVLSNSDHINAKHYFSKGWYDPFDILFLSHELGISKPSKEIYEHVIKELKTTPEEILFIDDREECLTIPRELGIKTILFKSPEQLKKELIELNINF